MQRVAILLWLYACILYGMSADMLRQNFEIYGDQLSDLHAQIHAGVEPNTLTGFRYTYIDEHFAHSFDLLQGKVGLLFEVDDEIEDEVPLTEHLRTRVETMRSALVHPTLEQIVAYSDSDVPAIVTETNSKYALSEVDDFCLNSISVGMYERLFATFRTMEDIGLAPFVAYTDSIKYPDITVENMDEDHDLIVTKYEQSPNSSFMHHVLRFGKDLVEGARGKLVPDFATRYYLACDKYIGKEAGLELIHTWLRSGRGLPPIDYALE